MNKTPQIRQEAPHEVDWRADRLADLEQAVAAADRGEFASEEEVDALYARHGA